MTGIEFPHPNGTDELIVTNLIVCDDLETSKHFYIDILGATPATPAGPGPSMVKLANAWFILVNGGEPTPDKPTVTLTAPTDLDHVDSFLNLRVADIATTHREWTARGAQFLTEPLSNHGAEMRCYLRDPSGHLIEVGQVL